MPTYSFRATSGQGEPLSGTEQAKSERELAQLLRAKGYVVTSVVQKKERKPFAVQTFLDGFFGVPLEERLVFMRNLKIMVGAGIPLPKALDVLHEQAKSKKLKDAASAMKERVLQGEALSAAMGAHPAIFSELVINMIKAGEESGTLESVFAYLTLQLEKEHDIKSKVQGALMYPAIILIAMTGIGLLMLVTVVPNLAKTFRDLGVTLPLTTKLVIAFGEALSHYWYIAIPVMLGMGFVSLRVLRTQVGKKIVDAVLLRLPVASGIVRKVNSAFFARTLSSLIGAGIPIVRSLEITANVLGNSYFKNALLAAKERVAKGTKLSETLKDYRNLYPVVVVQMIEVGEETGETGEILSKLAEFFEEEVSNITKNLAAIIEPILMLIIGVVVGFFAISMIQPMYSLLGGIQ